MPSLPQYLMGLQGQLDFEPINQGLGRYFQQQQLQRENEFKQRQIGMDEQRLGFEGERLGFDRAAATRAQELFPLQRQQMQGGISAQNQALRSAEQDYGFKGEMHPLELAAKRKALESQKFGTIKEGDIPYAVDPSAPGGVRFLEVPNASGPGQKKFNEKAAEGTAERYVAIAKHGDTIPEQMFNLKRLEDLSTVIGAPNAKTQIAAKFGPTLKAMGLDPKNMSEIELFSSLVSKMAPNLRPPGSGATSDFDLQQYINSLPQIVQTVPGRQMLIQHLRAVAQYSDAQSKIAKKAMLGKITRDQAEIEIESLPDPHSIWRQAVGQQTAPTTQAAPAPQPGGAQPERAVRVRTPEDARKLPSGTTIILPDGSLGRVP